MSTVSYKALALWAQVTETMAEDKWSSLFTSGSPLEGVKEVTMRNFQKIFEKLQRHNIGSEFLAVTDVSSKVELRARAQQLLKFLSQRNLWLAKWDIDTAECLFLFLQYKGQLKRAKARIRKSRRRYVSFGAHLLSLTLLSSKRSAPKILSEVFRGILQQGEVSQLLKALRGEKVELTPEMGAIFYRLNKREEEVPLAKIVLRGEQVESQAASVIARDRNHAVRGDPEGKRKLIPDLEIDWDVGTMVTVFAVLSAGLLLIERTTYVAGVAWWYTILGGLLFGIFYFLAFPPLVLVSEKRRMNRVEH